MKIKDLLQYLQVRVWDASILEREITHLTCESNQVGPGTLFVAIKGVNRDGHDFVEQAAARGAAACIVDSSTGKNFPKTLPLIYVEKTRFVFSLLSARFFEQPSRDVEVIGITGTNGKTTTSFLIQHLYSYFATCGLIGTIHYQIGSQLIPSNNTTPSAYDLNWMLAQMRKLKTRYCSMEVSSHALDQERVSHLFFRSAIFTNLTQDHLDYHRDFETYFRAKERLFTKDPRPEKSFVNADDPYGRRLIESVYPRPYTYAIQRPADFRAVNIRVALDRVEFEILTGKGKAVPVKVGMPCLHNVYNVLSAFACAHTEGWDPVLIAEVLRMFPGVPGRMERVDRGQDFYVFVDYAHTPDAFQNVLSSVRSLAGRRVITVFGCGGDRDRTKRPLMGRIAGHFSDVVVLTSDNPRSENPEEILDQIARGITPRAGQEVIRIAGREEAIARALESAGSDDVVLILGKGHENYQIIGGEKNDFDDRVCVDSILSRGGRVERPGY